MIPRMNTKGLNWPFGSTLSAISTPRSGKVWKKPDFPPALKRPKKGYANLRHLTKDTRSSAMPMTLNTKYWPIAMCKLLERNFQGSLMHWELLKDHLWRISWMMPSWNYWINENWKRSRKNGGTKILTGTDHNWFHVISKRQDITVWKFQDFSVTQILRGINFGESKRSKPAVFAILGALNIVDLVNFSL